MRSAPDVALTAIRRLLKPTGVDKPRPYRPWWSPMPICRVLWRRKPENGCQLLENYTRGDNAAKPNVDLRWLDLRKLACPDNTYDLHDARLTGSDLRDAAVMITSLERADARGVRLERANLAGPGRLRVSVGGANLTGVTGLFGAEKATLTLEWPPHKPPRFQRWGAGRRFGDFPSWRDLHLIGAIPLFAVSNLTLIGILVYSGLARWYNAQLARIQTGRLTDAAPDRVQDWIAHLHPAPRPAHLGYILLAIIVLSIAATIYRLACPDIAKDYSQVEWDSGQRPRWEYPAANYCRPWARWTCAILYFGGGLYVLWYLAQRVFYAVEFFFLSTG